MRPGAGRHRPGRRPAVDAAHLGYLARCLVEAALPYRRVPGPVFRRHAGHLGLTLRSDGATGLPYGRYPRLFLLWLSTRALRTGCRRLPLDGSLGVCLREMGIGRTGGRHGTLGRFREQARRLLATTIEVSWDDGVTVAAASFPVARRSRLWWEAAGEDGAAARVVLSRAFFAELTAHPVPLDLRAYRGLSSALARDVYVWLSYRLGVLQRPRLVRWEQLHQQFGSQTRRRRDFVRALRGVLPDVLAVYPAARVRWAGGGLLLKPSPSSVPAGVSRWGAQSSAGPRRTGRNGSSRSSDARRSPR